MDDASMNHYEKQLYSVFKTFDVDNEEALDRSAVHELCDALQLEDRGAALVNTLFERRSDRVTFAQFRNGLLAVLGGSSSDPTRPTPPPPDPPPQADAATHSDEDSSGREVAPKFVFGSKKYGRRSRPSRPGSAAADPPSPRSSSVSRLDTDDKKARQQMRCKRSTSAMESRADDDLDGGHLDVTSADEFDHNRRIGRDEALALCRGLNMDGIDRRLVERIFEASSSSDTTVGEFFDRLNASLTTTMEEASRDARQQQTGADADEGDDEARGLAAELVLDAWQRAGVRAPRRLLAELGFVGSVLRPPELERALDDELRALAEPADEPRDARAILLLAALALSRLRMELARRRADVTAAERDKLRGDVAEANRHARHLAQEVDESHARIETELKTSLRRAEARHAEASRQVAAEHAAERERAASERARLEAELARRAEAEARLRGEAAAQLAALEAQEARAAAAELRGAEAERERARLAAELRAAEQRAAAGGERAHDAELGARLAQLQHEHARLRDRHDELCAALEARRPPAPPPPGAHLSAELHSLLPQERAEECDSSPASIDRRIVGHLEAVTRLRDLLDGAQDIPFAAEQTCTSCDCVRDAVRQLASRARDLSDAVIVAGQQALVDGGAQTDSVAADADTDTDADADTLRRQLCDLQQTHQEEKQKLSSLIKDLESSLEQMKAEYDKCEEYWSGKLEEERDTYAEEQRLGDERLADLVAKIAEYERQFQPAAGLATIEERHSLEVQYSDLEDEFAAYRRDKEAELARLVARVRALERRPEPRAASPPRRAASPPRHVASPPRPAAELRELRLRTARAEAAARRLHARLAAADLLVKDLYVENCQLAHRRPL